MSPPGVPVVPLAGDASCSVRAPRPPAALGLVPWGHLRPLPRCWIGTPCMCVCVSACMSMCVHTYLCMYVCPCVSVHVSIRICACTSVHECPCMCVCPYVSVHVHMCPCISVHVHVCLCMCTHAYLCMYMCVRVCLCMYMCVHACLCLGGCGTLCVPGWRVDPWGPGCPPAVCGGPWRPRPHLGAAAGSWGSRTGARGAGTPRPPPQAPAPPGPALGHWEVLGRKRSLKSPPALGFALLGTGFGAETPESPSCPPVPGPAHLHQCLRGAVGSAGHNGARPTVWGVCTVGAGSPGGHEGGTKGPC